VLSQTQTQVRVRNSLLAHCRNASPIAAVHSDSGDAQIDVGTAERVRALGAASVQEDDARPCSLLDPDLHHTFDELYACDRSALLVSIARTIAPHCTALHCGTLVRRCIGAR
jgi:hypothetical protein